MTRVLKKSQDWHPADVKASLEKRGLSLASLEREAGYSRGAFSHVWTRCYPEAQKIIAKALNVEPWKIWPDRYRDKNPLRGRDVFGGPHW